MDATKLHLKPATPELVVLHPTTLQPLPPEGALVDDDTYWHRRLREGDVVLVQPQANDQAQPEEAQQ